MHMLTSGNWKFFILKFYTQKFKISYHKIDIEAISFKFFLEVSFKQITPLITQKPSLDHWFEVDIEGCF